MLPFIHSAKGLETLPGMPHNIFIKVGYQTHSLQLVRILFDERRWESHCDADSSWSHLTLGAGPESLPEVS